MLVAVLFSTAGAQQIPATLEDFFQLGTQPDKSGGKHFAPILNSFRCSVCHEINDPDEVPIYTRWHGSMMGNSVRDPLFHACMAIANQDVAFAGDLCLRCHAPGGWLAGRSTPTDGSALTPHDFDGITCNFCHRAVDPVFRPGVSPPEDQMILTALESAGLLPINPGGGNYVVDPRDTRRGPFDDVPLNVHGSGVPIVHSPFHTTSELCATCHEVSNPALVRQMDGSYAMDQLGAAHPTQDKFDMFPLERTYSEWANSQYATVGVHSGGVFGGNHPTGIMRTCQDCHMPDEEAYGCAFQEDPFFVRPNVPSHDFNGGNTWMPEVLYNLYPELRYEYLMESRDRARYMLENAATVNVTRESCSIRVRITNETGHKLPTGYPEGRRMWINVLFRDSILNPVADRGNYHEGSATLSASDTKVYEGKLGLDAAMAQLSGVSEGPSFHFALNNKWFKDNRIPPRGFTNEAFTEVQAQPIGATYADGQYWDDTLFRIPPGAVAAVVTVYYQTASKEYITFLRDENHTNDAGDLVYEQWELTGKSAPVKMKRAYIGELVAGLFGDGDCDGDVDLADYEAAGGDCVTGVDRTLSLGCEVLDSDLDGDVDLSDVAAFQRAFTGP